MGSLFRMSSGCECTTVPAQPRLSYEPDPYTFKLIASEQHGSLWVAIVEYPDCITFEGLKVLVLDRDPNGMTALDPHFNPGGYLVARFAPTEKGKQHARMFAAEAGRI